MASPPITRLPQSPPTESELIPPRTPANTPPCRVQRSTRSPIVRYVEASTSEPVGANARAAPISSRASPACPWAALVGANKATASPIAAAMGHDPLRLERSHIRSSRDRRYGEDGISIAEAIV